MNVYINHKCIAEKLHFVPKMYIVLDKYIRIHIYSLKSSSQYNTVMSAMCEKPMATE